MCLSLSLSFSMYVCMSLSISLSVSLPLPPSSLSLSLSNLSLFLSLSLSLSLLLSLSLSLSLSFPVFLSNFFFYVSPDFSKCDSLLHSFTDLVACILDSISNLCLPSNSVAMKKVLSATHILLGTAEHSLLPVIARFSLESADADSVDYILKGLTEKLGDFLATFSGMQYFYFLIKSYYFYFLIKSYYFISLLYQLN